MSVESAKKFIEKVKNDEDFKKSVSESKDGQERMAFAKAQGFDFTVSEFKEASGQELSDDDLNAVAGGCWGGHLCLDNLGDANLGG